MARSLLVSRLTAAGLEAVDVASAPEALAVDLDALACAVVDVELGPSSGLDLADALTARSPRLPIAFFTGGGLKEAAHPVFVKPRDLDNLIAWALDRCS